jgi:methylated-DNA-[protein]-cysteine S-methyltransferase
MTRTQAATVGQTGHEHYPRYQRLATPYGPMVAAASNAVLSGLWFEPQQHFPNLGAMQPDEGQNAALWHDLQAQLNAYAAGDLQRFELPLHFATGSAFAHSVWHELLKIDFGQTATYGDLAARLGSAPRAVGAAVGRNPIAIIVPCHRVVGKDGALTGYAGGLHTKTALLRLEHYFD